MVNFLRSFCGGRWKLALLLFCVSPYPAQETRADKIKVPVQCSRLIKRSETLISSGCSECCGAIKSALAVNLPAECQEFIFSELAPGIQKRLSNQAMFRASAPLSQIHGALLAMLKKKASQNKCELEPLAKNTTVNALASPGSAALPEHSLEGTEIPAKTSYAYSLVSSFGPERGEARSVVIELGHSSVIQTPKNKYAVQADWVTTSVYPTGILRTKITPMPGFNDFHELSASFAYGENCGMKVLVKKDPSKSIVITCTAKKQGPVSDLGKP
jgi:hypothetical protein